MPTKSSQPSHMPSSRCSPYTRAKRCVVIHPGCLIGAGNRSDRSRTSRRSSSPHAPADQRRLSPSPVAIAGLEPSCMSTKHSSPVPVQRLNRVQQLTLNTWRLASTKLERVLDPCSLLKHAAIYATLGALPDVDEPLDLFRRHAEAQPEFALIVSLIRAAGQEALAYDILDTAILLRWNELIAGGNGPEELPPLRPCRRSPTKTSTSTE